MLKTVTNIVNVSQITGVLPVVNGGTGVTTSTGTGNVVLSAAPTLSGNVTLSTGNLIVASGQGIDFSATPGTGTSELLADYEEGTWTPTVGTNLTVAGTFSSSGKYTKIGRQVTVIATLVGSTSLSTITGGVICASLPFTVSGLGLGNIAVFGAGTVGETLVVTTSVISQTALGPITEIYFSATYFV